MKLIISEDYNTDYNSKAIWQQFYYDEYYQLLHNLAGPALVTKNGKLIYYINGVRVGVNLSNKEFQKIVKEHIFSS